MIRVRRNASFGYVANALAKRHLIPSAFAFKLYARFTHRGEKLRIGDYQVQDKMRPVDILDLLASGRSIAFPLTIPEGKWASEIAKELAPQLPAAAQTFEALVDAPQRWRAQVKFPLVGPSLEGYLFPDTYQLAPTLTAEQVIGKMLNRFSATCWKAYQTDTPHDGRSLYQVLTLASLVEAEAKVDAERPIIAGVYMNRLRQGMALDCDATLVYARQQRIRRVLNKDTAMDSPYNTYRHTGLPPGPINNPGLKSFTAALHPATTPYVYYVAKADGSGTHLFARTLAEQSANIQRIRGK
jgi:UPF0755 protein